MSLSGPKDRKHRSPHELCGKICYCSWPPKICMQSVLAGVQPLKTIRTWRLGTAATSASLLQVELVQETYTSLLQGTANWHHSSTEYRFPCLFGAFLLAKNVLEHIRKEDFSWTLTGQKFKLNFAIFLGENDPLPTAMFPILFPPILGDGRNTFSRALFRNRENSLSSAANSVSSAKKNSVSSLRHTKRRPRGTQNSFGEDQKTHWARCLKPCSSKPYSASLWVFLVFPRIARVPYGEKNPCFLRGFPCSFFSKKIRGSKRKNNCLCAPKASLKWKKKRK